MFHIIDHYSKFLFGKLLLKKDSLFIINFLENIFLLTGALKEIGADKGKEFKNKNFNESCNK